MNKNPYQSEPAKIKGAGPILAKLPMFEFKDIHELEQQLLRGEVCIAKIENPRPAGFLYDVALVYKDEEDRVYSLQLMQHHGELKDTQENREIMFGGGNDKGETFRNETDRKSVV